MNSHDTFLLNLFMILIFNNLVSMFVYEVSLKTIKTPFVIKSVGFFTALVTLAIGTIFFLEFYAYLKEVYSTVSHTYRF